MCVQNLCRTCGCPLSLLAFQKCYGRGNYILCPPLCLYTLKIDIESTVWSTYVPLLLKNIKMVESWVCLKLPQKRPMEMWGGASETMVRLLHDRIKLWAFEIEGESGEV
jgi:hypothetical protein